MDKLFKIIHKDVKLYLIYSALAVIILAIYPGIFQLSGWDISPIRMARANSLAGLFLTAE